jgi:prevent-host-death family protein
MSTMVNIAEFKDRLSEFLEMVEKGGEVIVCRRNVPLAKIEPIRHATPAKPKTSVLGCMKGTLAIHGDLSESCIPETDWEMLR